MIPRLRAVAVFVGAIMLATPPASAGVSSADPVFEVVPAPPSLRQDAFESDTAIRVIRERSGFTLPTSVDVDITEPGTYELTGDLTNAGTIPAGDRVSSYILHSDSAQMPVTDLSGTLRFEEEIAALIVRFNPMAASDGVLGAPGTAYPTTKFDRALEVWASTPSDRVELHPDRRTLTVRMKVGGVLDELRVITRRATTSLDARPLVATLPAEIHAPMFSARLTDSSSGGPVAGRLVTFTSLDDATVHCSGSTDPDGMASCPYGTTLATAVLDGGYRATFAGDDTFDSSTGVAPLARVLGIDIP